MAGTPVALHTAVNATIGASPCSYFSSVPSMRTVPSRQRRAGDGRRQEDVEPLEEGAELSARAMEGLHGANVVVRADPGALLRVEPRHRLEIVRPRHAAVGADLYVGEGIGAHHRAEGLARRFGVVVRRGLLDEMTERFQPLRRAFDGGYQHRVHRLPAHGLAQEGDAELGRRPPGRIEERAFGLWRAVRIARLTACQRVEQRRTVTDRDRYA